MAIITSPECSFPFINCTKTTNKSSIDSTCNFFPISRQCPNSRTLLTKSSSSSSPLQLEHHHSSSSTELPMPELNQKLQDDLQPSSLQEIDDINGFIFTMFEDRRTEELAYKYYEKAKENPDFRPWKSTLKHLIRYLTRSKKWGMIFSLSEYFKNFKVFPDSSTCCGLISSCVTARKSKTINSLLDVFKSHDEVAVWAFDSAMKGYNRLHMYRSTIALYEKMVSFAIVLDFGCFCRIMEAYLKTDNHEKVVSLFEEFKGINRGPSPFESQIYWFLCESLGKSGRPLEALEMFREMKKRGIPENHHFYSSIICSIVSTRKIKMAEELLREAESKKMLRDPSVFLKLVLMYVEEGLMENTLEIVATMKRANISVTDCISCTIVNGFAKRRGNTKAVEVYEGLILMGCVPGQVTYASIINVYCRLGQYAKAEKVFSEMEKRGFDKCVVAYSSMVSMYGKTGRLRDAVRLVAKIKARGCEPNVWIYNSLLDMHGRVLNLTQVEKLWKEMKRSVPDKVSYTSVVSAYSKARDYETCMKYYQEFRLNGGVIDRAMAGIMVSVFSKINRIEDLMKLLQDLKSQGTKLDERLYLSAFNAFSDVGLQMQSRWLKESFEMQTI